MGIENEETKNEDVNDEIKDEALVKNEEENPIDVLTKGMEDIFEEKVEVEEENKEENKEEIKDEDKQSELEDLETEEVSDGGKKVEADDSHDGESKDEYETVPIPKEQVDIARSLGYSDDEIVKTAEEHPERLVNMVRMYSKPTETQRELKEVVAEKKEIPKLDHMKIDNLDELEPESANVIKSILKAHNSLIDHTNEQEERLASLGERATTVEERDKTEAVNKIDAFFDEVSEDLPELGKAETLTHNQVKTRREVYGIAAVMQNTRGISERKALEEAVAMCSMSKVDLDEITKGAEEKVKEKLNKQKTKMSPRPGGKKKVEKPELGKDAAIDFLSSGMKEILG